LILFRFKTAAANPHDGHKLRLLLFGHLIDNTAQLAFGAIQAAGTVEPSLVAHGIKVALLTTAAGLIVAVPINIAYNFFVSRIDMLIVDMEHGSQKVINLAWDLEKKGRLKIVEAA